MWEEKVGVIHVHSRHSDGRGTVPTIARAAVRAGLDFVIITDHGSLAGLHAGEEGRYDKALVIIGQEISPDDGDHYIALGINTDVPTAPNPQTFIDAVAAQGGLGFIAHPDYPEPERYPLQPYPWAAWDVKGYTGLEIWSYTVDWLVDVTTVPRLIRSLLFPKRFIQGPFPKTLARWDELCREAWRRRRRVVGIGSADAHGILYSYRRMFTAMRMHVLVQKGWGTDSMRDKARILEALGEGRAYIAYDGLLDATGFSFNAQNRSVTVPMGAGLSLSGGVMLNVKTPASCRITLLHNGDVLAQRQTTTMEERVTVPGVYRVEARMRDKRGWQPWVFSNPIYVD